MRVAASDAVIPERCGKESAASRSGRGAAIAGDENIAIKPANPVFMCINRPFL
jgi:hypothetical protein